MSARPGRYQLHRIHWLLAAAVVLYAFYFSYLTLTRYAAFESRSLDMGNLNQAVWNTAHGNWFHQTNQPGVTNRLSLHVEPILLPIAALYRLFPGAELLLILQSVVVALGAVPVFALGVLKLRSAWLALVFSLAFLLSPAIQAANWLEFHPVTLAPTMLLAAFYCLVTRRPAWFALFALLAASCKEDVGLLVSMLGLYALIALRQRRLGVITMVLALGWSLVAVLVIQGSFGGNIHWSRYAYLGDSPGEMLVTALTHPSLILQQLEKADASGYLTQLLVPVGFTALLAPEVLLLALPSFALNLLADFPPMHQVNSLIYAAPIAPFVVLAGIMGVSKLQIRLFAAGPNRLPAAAGGRAVLQFVLGLLVLTSSLLAHSIGGYLPSGGNHRLYTVTAHHEAGAALIAQIPPDAAVSAQDKLNPHISGRTTSYIFPELGGADAPQADTALLDVTGPAWPQHPNDVHATVQKLLAADWGVTAADDGYLLLRRGETRKTPPPEFYSAWNSVTMTPTFSQQVDFGDELRLLGYDVTDDAHGELVVNLVWQAQRPLTRNLNFYVAYLDNTGAVLAENQFYQPVATLWYPSSMWQPGSSVLVQTLPWSLAQARFTLALAVYAEDPVRGRLPVSLPVSLPETLQTSRVSDNLVRLGAFQRRQGGGWEAASAADELPATRLDAHFGGEIDLDGVTITSLRQDKSLAVKLFWRAVAAPAADYHAFVHVLDDSGARVAQLDWPPGDLVGPLPTTLWSPGQLLVDERVLTLPPDLAAGKLHLIVGLYDWRSNERLAATGANSAADNSVMLGELTWQ